MCHFILKSINSLFCIIQFVSMCIVALIDLWCLWVGRVCFVFLGVITKHPFYWFFWILSWLIIDEEKGIEFGIRASSESQGEVRSRFLGVYICVSFRCFIKSNVTQSSPGAWWWLEVIKHLSAIVDYIKLCLHAGISSLIFILLLSSICRSNWCLRQLSAT